jgi:hypothetical protein
MASRKLLTRHPSQPHLAQTFFLCDDDDDDDDDDNDDDDDGGHNDERRFRGSIWTSLTSVVAIESGPCRSTT